MNEFKREGFGKPVVRIAGAWLVLGVLSSAQGLAAAGKPIPYRKCFQAAAAKHGVAEELLLAIAHTESRFNADAQHTNTNGTTDYGVMQVNSIHLSWLLPKGINEYHLIQEPCTNIEVGASILGDFLRKYGSTWRAVGAYGAGDQPGKEAARLQYALKVRESLSRLLPASAQALPLSPAIAQHQVDISAVASSAATTQKVAQRPQMQVLQ